MKGGAASNDFRVSLQPATPLRLSVLQLVKGGEDPIGEWFVGERPQTFCRLQFWGVRRQKEQMQSFWKHQVATLVPACLIEH